MSSPAKPLADAISTPLAREIAAGIAARGPISFAEFMEACLYDPAHGYYNQPERTRFADYYTSVDVHPIFGRLLARQLEEMWRLLDRPAQFYAVEPGAGVGRLAAQILDFCEAKLPEFYSALLYVAVERSEARRAAHAKTIGKHIAAGRAESSAELPARIPHGCIVSNEFFDAMPVHRVIFQGAGLQEIHVGMKNDRFADSVGPLSAPRIADYFSRQGITLQEGQQAEVGLAACNCIADAARRLERGFVITVDYGYEAQALYSERFARGTVLAYRNHQVSEDYYAAPGEQDLTAHVNLTALDLWGSDAGLERAGIVPQTRFLIALGRGNEFADLYDAGQSETDRMRAQMQLSSLLHPEGMGETFQVFIQRKGIGEARLAGLAPL
ncbi:MAG TPA: SAM-dependent methyltransferase [Candidatus Acidoferrales bacterium]|jgi:SAM-dependent MidA family methyltransferase|nr:SAM-dependent methyltransferase [Candidatus Acidoferrales bacterium]